jgi:tetratricopeptide (TPR) repeat protein
MKALLLSADMKLLSPLTLCLALLALAAACTSPAPKSDKQLNRLKASLLYDPDSVFWFTAKISEENKSAADYYHGKARGMQDQDTVKAIHYLKKSLTLYPKPSVYRELGDMFSAKRDYREATKAYYTLVKLYPKEVSESGYYQIILTSFLAGIYYMDELTEAASKSGADLTDIRKKLEKEESLQQILKDAYVRDEVMYLFYDEDAPDVASYAEFAAGFPEKQLPLEISIQEASNFNYGDQRYPRFYRNYISGYTENQYFSMNFIGKFPLSNYQGFLYAVDSSVNGLRKEMRMIYYKLAIFTPDGKLTDEKTIGCHAGEELRTFALNSGGVTVKNYRRSWKKSFNYRDPDNEITAVIPEAAETFSISPEGKIISGSQPPPQS